MHENNRDAKQTAADFPVSAQNGTTDIKLSILPQLMQLHHSANMVGDYDNTKSVLYTEKLAGNISACTGFVKEKTITFPTLHSEMSGDMIN